MSFINEILGSFGHEAARLPGSYVEAPRALMHEVAEGLSPMAIERAHTVKHSVDGSIMPMAYSRLGADAVAALLRAVNMAPAIEPPQINHAAYAVAPPATAAAAAQEQQSGFWGDNPEDQRLLKAAGWDGAVAPVPQDPAALNTAVTAEQFFAQDFQMMPPAAAWPAAENAHGTYGYAANPLYATEQDIPVDAGMTNPQVDETRKMWDEIGAMPDAPAAGPLDNLSAEEVAARVNAARPAWVEAAQQQVVEAHS